MTLNLERAQRRAPPGSGVPSPCIGVCRMDEASGCCSGCWRTLDEIARWSTASEAEKRVIWAALERRQPGAPDSPQGHRA